MKCIICILQTVYWRLQRGSNPRSQPWQGCAITNFAMEPYGGSPWTRTRNAEATDLQSAALPIPLTDPNLLLPIKIWILWLSFHNSRTRLLAFINQYKIPITIISISNAHNILSKITRKCNFEHFIFILAHKKSPTELYPNIFGWGRWIRTIGMQESKSCALPLGDTPIFERLIYVLKESPTSRNLFSVVTKRPT